MKSIVVVEGHKFEVAEPPTDTALEIVVPEPEAWNLLCRLGEENYYRGRANEPMLCLARSEFSEKGKGYTRITLEQI